MSAQDGETGEDAKLVPPKLEEFTEAEYPERALEASVEGDVELILRIDREGRVTEARVEDGPGHGLNRAARRAARKFVFRPARRNGEPVPSKIRYTYEFELPGDRTGETPDPDASDPATREAEDEPQTVAQSGSTHAENRDDRDVGDEAPSPDSSDASTGDRSEPDAEAVDGPEASGNSEGLERGRLGGRVQLGSSGAPAAGIDVTLQGPGGSNRTLRTDSRGRFLAESLTPGTWRVTARAPGGATTTLETAVEAGEGTEVSLRIGGAESTPLEVTVEGQSEGDLLEDSARAVDVIDTGEASRKADDMGDVLARQEGTGVRRTGGLGSGTRLSLNGLNDNQVRFTLDGVPLEYAGFPFGISNVPVNLVDRVDVYSGVVPIQFGADALGGAVNLVTPDAPEKDGFRGSYQFGSFDTHRATASGRLVDEETGVYTQMNAFVDHSENDYDVDVEVADRSGQISDVTARRFHDTYRAFGAGLTYGVVDRTWADDASIRVFGTDFARDLQHNLIMSDPFGEARYGESAVGALARYEHTHSNDIELDFDAGYNFTRTWLTDLTDCRYDWFGRCASERQRRGELAEFPSDRRLWEHAGFGRFTADWQIDERHTISASVAPTYVTRTGDDRVEITEDAWDPLEAERDLFDLVSGIEYRAALFDGRLENIAFVKDYIQVASTDERLASGARVEADRFSHDVGVGDSFRYRWTDWLRLKASYEWATRLPTAEEMFGDGVRIQPNPRLEPERSHNANLELQIDELETPSGTWRGTLTAFLRRTRGLIVLLGGADTFVHRNVLAARSAGFEASAGWTAPGEWLAVDLNTTYVDLRNVSRDGAFSDFGGDRIPNRPYLHANGTLRLQQTDLFTDGDALTATWQSRYVHSYYRGWESLGRRDFKQVIPEQWVQSVSLGYAVGDERRLTTTLEIKNMTDAKVFDFFGVQRPGRAFYLKTTLAL